MDNIAGNLILIGLMGAGKTTLGKQLANKLRCTFYDSDQVICERTGVSIPTIFELEGEAGFRSREAMIIGELVQKKNTIIATGGGAVLQLENRLKLQQNGHVIYLHAQPEVLLGRIQHDKNRPLLQVSDPLAKLQELYTIRDPIYRATAHTVMDVGSPDSAHTVNRLIRLLRPPSQQLSLL
ncbi:shikimate kinase [Snodgrassella alvi]|uniref:shikimate kinase n=1 Tax=Snodgrassella alvi TaxID=1196083 RepID=UPI000CB1F74D|nr:shikimate kinase [Snodgrassella alvi]PIT08432.1 shikimate kinase [Snodgrassella alvi]PIT56034.1 shikimate kinase [Snodgrassella alvi]